MKARAIALIAAIFAIVTSTSSVALAGACAISTLDVYTASGFTCTIGDLQFSNFSWSGNSIGGTFETENLPASIAVTPEDLTGQSGFTFSNLGLSFNAPGSNVSSSVSFNVTASSGAIDGAYLALGRHGFTGTGWNYAFFESLDDALLAVVADPSNVVNNIPSLGTSSGAVSFADMTSMILFSGVSAGVDFPGGTNLGTASTDGYEVLLNLAGAQTPPATGIPEPASLALVGAGVAGAVAMRRRNAKRA